MKAPLNFQPNPQALCLTLALGILPKRNRVLPGPENAPGGCVNLPSLPAFLPALALQFFGVKTAPCHNRAQRGQHRLSLPRRCTEATRPVGGAHKLSQGLTRIFAVLGCSARCRSVVIGREWTSKNLPPDFRFSEPFGRSQLASENFSMITAW